MLYDDIYSVIIDNIRSNDECYDTRSMDVIKNLRQSSKMLLNCVNNIRIMHYSVYLNELFGRSGKCLFPKLEEVKSDIVVCTYDGNSKKYNTYVGCGKLSMSDQIQKIKHKIRFLVHTHNMKKMRICHHFLGELDTVQRRFKNNYEDYYNFAGIGDYVAWMQRYLSSIFDDMLFLSVSYRDWLIHPHWKEYGNKLDIKYPVFTSHKIINKNCDTKKQVRISFFKIPSHRNLFDVLSEYSNVNYYITLDGNIKNMYKWNFIKERKLINTVIVTDETSNKEISFIYSEDCITRVMIESAKGMKCFMEQLNIYINEYKLNFNDQDYPKIKTIIIPENYKNDEISINFISCITTLLCNVEIEYCCVG